MSAQTARYDPTKSRRPRTESLAYACLKTAGVAPGSIIAATINTHRLVKEANEPGPVTHAPLRSAGPARIESMPLICWSTMTHATAPSPTVVSAATARMAGEPITIDEIEHHL